MPSFPTGTFVGQSIGFSEAEDSPQRSHSGGISVISLHGWTAWSDAPSFVSFLMPVGYNVGGMIGASWNVEPAFRVFEYSVKGFGGITGVDASGANTFALAEWNIKLHVPTGQLPDLSQPYNNDPVPLLQHTWKGGGMNLTLNSASQKWESTGLEPSVRIPGTIFLGTISHSVKWPNLLNPPFAAIKNAMNSINSSPMTFATGVAATGQLLFLNADVETTIGSDNQLLRSVTYNFTERPLYVGTVALDWNMYFRDDGAAGYQNTGWDRLLNQYTGLPSYKTTDFRALFPNVF